MKGGVFISLNFERYGNEVAALVAQRTAAEIVRRARKIVRVKTGQLRNSIKNIGVTKFKFLAVAETPYAAAQEWGREDLPQYGFTPYMTPAAEEATSPGIFKQIVREAELGAAMKSARRK